MIHWTQTVLMAITALCLAANARRYLDTKSVRLLGLAVCLGWFVQFAIKLKTEQDSITVFLLCDGLILGLAIRERHWTAWGIAALMPVCWACYWPIEGLERETWWLNFSAVILQCLLGLPWPALQRSDHTFSHGPLRRTTI